MKDDVAKPAVISIAILAMGGEGGGVLADWIVDLAEHVPGSVFRPYSK